MSYFSTAEANQILARLHAAPPTAIFTRPEAAIYLGVEVQTLAAWPGRGIGPRFIKMGKLAKYRKADLDAFCAKNVVEIPASV